MQKESIKYRLRIASTDIAPIPKTDRLLKMIAATGYLLDIGLDWIPEFKTDQIKNGRQTAKLAAKKYLKAHENYIKSYNEIFEQFEKVHDKVLEFTDEETTEDTKWETAFYDQYLNTTIIFEECLNLCFGIPNERRPEFSFMIDLIERFYSGKELSTAENTQMLLLSNICKKKGTELLKQEVKK